MTNTDAIRALFSRYNAKDLDGAAQLAAPDFRLDDIPMGMSFHGPEGLRQWLATFAVAAPDSQAEVTNLIAEGDWVASEHQGGGTHTGILQTPQGEVPPTGKRFTLTFGEFYRFRDGKLVVMKAYYDLATFMRQLGLM